MTAREALAALDSIFASCLDGARLLARVHDEDPLGWLNFRRITNERWHNDNVVLMGDAAHTTHFTIGSGAKLAIQDAIGLAECLDRHDEVQQALGEYENERRAALLRAQSDARYSTLWFENVPRYIELKPRYFLALMDARRSPLQPSLDPRLFYVLHRLFHLLHRASEKVGVLRAVRRRTGAGVRALGCGRCRDGAPRRGPPRPRRPCPSRNRARKTASVAHAEAHALPLTAPVWTVDGSGLGIGSFYPGRSDG